MYSASVIIPTWNSGSTVRAAIQSALAQRVPPREVLVCDDGSTDSTHEVVARLGDPRVKWLAGFHSGLPAVARNRGIAQSQGEWIAFLDSDDIWAPDKLLQQFRAASGSASPAICSNAHRVVRGRYTGQIVNWKRSRLPFSALTHTNYVVCSSAVIHRSLLPLVEGFPESKDLRGYNDYALWLRVAALTDFTFIPRSLVSYQDEPSISMRKDAGDHWTQKAAVLEDFLKWGAARGVPAKHLRLAQKSLDAGDSTWSRARARVHRLFSFVIGNIE